MKADQQFKNYMHM